MAVKRNVFSKLPHSFSFHGERIDNFQTGFCLFCDWRIRKELLLRRAFNVDVADLIESRKRCRRLGFDRAFKKVFEKAKIERDQEIKNGLKVDKFKKCPRCLESWKATKEFFRPNPKKGRKRSSLRGICTFCDHYFETAIDRRKRDQLSYQDLADARSKYLKIGRERH